MTCVTDGSNGMLRVSERGGETVGTKIRLTADQSRAAHGLLDWALEASDRPCDDQDWFIAATVGLVLDLDDEPNDHQYGSAVAIIGALAAKLMPSRRAVEFSVDEQWLLAALIDHAFYQDELHDRQQWPIEAAATALHPNLYDAPNAAHYNRACRILSETRARLEPLPTRPVVRVGDCLLAWDLGDLDENEDGYRIVAVDAATVTVRDADGVDHAICRDALEAGNAGVVRYFGDFETQPDDHGYQERRQHEREEWTRRLAEMDKERRARAFADPYLQLQRERSGLDARIADCERLIAGFRSGATASGHIERSVGKQEAKIAKLAAARLDITRSLATRAAELHGSGEPGHPAVLAWQAANDAVAALVSERNTCLIEIFARFAIARAAGPSEADTIYHRYWQATIEYYEEQIEAASDRAAAAFRQLVEPVSSANGASHSEQGESRA